jgi:hypothetical protein
MKSHFEKELKRLESKVDSRASRDDVKAAIEKSMLETRLSSLQDDNARALADNARLSNALYRSSSSSSNNDELLNLRQLASVPGLKGNFSIGGGANEGRNG